MTNLLLALTLVHFAQTPSPGLDAARPQSAYIVATRGLVKLKRSSWNDFHSVSFGTILYAGDLLEPEPTASATILCADFQSPPWQPHTGIPSAVEDACPKPMELLRLPTGLTVQVRASPSTDAQILSPRGLIRDENPSILWDSFGSGLYEVRILEGTRPFWGWVLIKGTQAHMSLLAEPDRPYYIQVRIPKTHDQIETDIPFSLVSKEVREKIQLKEAWLATIFAEDIRTLKMARVFLLFRNHLWDEAIRLLDQASEDLPPSAAAELLRSKLLLGIGLQSRSAKALLYSSKLAEESGSPEIQAMALADLAQITANREQMLAYLNRALSLYEILGDKDRVASIQQFLREKTPPSVPF